MRHGFSDGDFDGAARGVKLSADEIHRLQIEAARASNELRYEFCRIAAGEGCEVSLAEAGVKSAYDSAMNNDTLLMITSSGKKMVLKRHQYARCWRPGLPSVKEAGL